MTQTFTISITDNPSIGNIAGFTETQGNFVQPNRLILDYDALLQYDTQINPAEELTYSYNSSVVILQPSAFLIHWPGKPRCV